MVKYCCYIICFLLLTACQQEDVQPLYIPALMEIPKGFPAIEAPDDNQFTIERWALGKRLFYDPILSVDSTVSCASCHQQDKAFSDGLTFSVGVENRVGTRNAPTLANIAYHPYFTREGGVPTLEMQILVPIQEHDEFDFNIVLLAERLQQDSSYVLAAHEAYQRAIDPFVITRALACFERSLISGNSAYDQYEFQNRIGALDDAALRGRDLFFSDRTNCSTCHSGFNFTNYTFENNGLYEEYEDEGRFRLTGEAIDRARFKVPSLRNVEWTGPYMHDGSIQTLEEVVLHYQNGGKNHPNKSTLIRPLNLTQTEIMDLVAFLQSLSDPSFIENSLFEQ